MELDDANAWKCFHALPSPGGAIPPRIRHPVRPKSSAQVDPDFLSRQAANWHMQEYRLLRRSAHDPK